MANNVTAVVIALATLTVGAIFSGTATDMGTQVGHSYLIFAHGLTIPPCVEIGDTGPLPPNSAKTAVQRSRVGVCRQDDRPLSQGLRSGEGPVREGSS